MPNFLLIDQRFIADSLMKIVFEWECLAVFELSCYNLKCAEHQFLPDHENFLRTLRLKKNALVVYCMRGKQG